MSEEAVRLEPSSGWVADYGDDYCKVLRLFGDEDNQHLLSIEQVAPNNRFMVTIAGRNFRRFAKQDTIAVGLESDQAMREDVRVTPVTFATYGPALILEASLLDGPLQEPPILPGIDPASAAKIDRIVFRHRSNVVSFETGNMEAPLKVLNDCTREFFALWGLDAEAYRGYTQPKIQNGVEFARNIQQAYPPEALRSDESASLMLRLIVEKDGSVSECHSLKVTQSDHLESAPCQSIGVAQFTPARDSTGQPIRSFWTTRVTYRIN